MEKNFSGNIHAKPTQRVGFVVKTQSYKGALKVSFDNESFEKTVSQSGFLLLQREGRWVPYRIEEYNENNGTIKLTGINSDKEAEPLTGLEIHLHQSDIKATDSAAFDLTGYTLLNQNKDKTGVITNLIEMPGHHLLEVKTENKTLLVPIHKSLIIEINEDERSVTLEIPEGLTDL